MVFADLGGGSSDFRVLAGLGSVVVVLVTMFWCAWLLDCGLGFGFPGLVVLGELLWRGFSGVAVGFACFDCRLGCLVLGLLSWLIIVCFANWCGA